MNEILVGDALEKLREIPDDSMDCCVTSPPYWGLRDYGVAGQIGLESTPEEYIAKMLGLFREVWRVLRPDGTLWLNLGDSYAGSGRGGNPTRESSTLEGGKDSQEASMVRHQRRNHGLHASAVNAEVIGTAWVPPPPGLKVKDLVGMPWRLAFALQAAGWYLRSDIVWAKPNPMPESVGDRPTKAHEYVFLLAKSERYYYDAEAIREPLAGGAHSHGNGPAAAVPSGWDIGTGNHRSMKGNYRSGNKERVIATEGERCRTSTHMGSSVPWQDTGAGRNKRSVWWVASEPFPEAHFATFPQALVEPCILAGTSSWGCCAACGAPWGRVLDREPVGYEDTDGKWAAAKAESGGRRITARIKAARLAGANHDNPLSRPRTIDWAPSCKCSGAGRRPAVVLDPFMGSGTVALVALRAGRNFMGVELNPEYVAIAMSRIAPELNQMRLA